MRVGRREGEYSNYFLVKNILKEKGDELNSLKRHKLHFGRVCFVLLPIMPISINTNNHPWLRVCRSAVVDVMRPLGTYKY